MIPSAWSLQLRCRGSRISRRCGPRVRSRSRAESRPVAVEIHRIGVMPGLTLALPEQLEFVVEDPEVPVAVLHQDLVAALVAGEVDEGDRIAVFHLVRDGRCRLTASWASTPTPASLPVRPSRICNWKSLTITTSLRPLPSISWIWNGVSQVRRPLRGSGRPDLPEDFAVQVDGGQATDLVEAVAFTLGMFCAMSMSGTPSPSRSPKRTFRPAPKTGVSNFFQSFGLGLSARRRASSASRSVMRSSIGRQGRRTSRRGNPGSGPGRGGDADLAFRQFGIGGFKHELVVDEGADRGRVSTLRR